MARNNSSQNLEVREGPRKKRTASGPPANGDSTKANGRKTGLLESKLYVPCPRPGIVPRQRLHDRLNEGMSGRLTLVSAPAGFGKSTLLTMWRCHTDRKVSCVSLDENDNNPCTFWSYVIAAFRNIDADLGVKANSILDAQKRHSQRPQQESFLAPLVNEVGGLKKNAALVLDDYHLITNPAIHEGVGFLIEHLPPQLHVIITSRADPPLPLARLRGRNQLNELRAKDLRFTPEESTSFLNGIMKLQLSAERITELEDRTEGWIVGLQLAALSIQGRVEKEVGEFITAFTGSHRFVVDYLVEEVFNTQPEHVRNFLLQTSILRRLNGLLCDEVTGQSGGMETLAMLERNNLFTIPLDERREWYRYHQLFAAVLRGRLEHEQPDIIPELHRRASGWFEQRGMVSEAMTHALASRDFERAARLVETHSEAMITRGETSTLLNWLDLLPVELVQTRPHLLLSKAWADISHDRMPEAKEYLASAERLVENPGLPAAEKQGVLGEAAAVRAMMGVIQDDVPSILESAGKALKYLPPDRRYHRGLVNMFLAVGHLMLGDFDEARRVGDEALRAGRAMKNQSLLYYSYFCIAGIHRMKSDLRRSAEVLRIALEAVQRPDGSYLPISTLAHRYLAELLYEWNDLDSAHRHVSLSIDLGQSWWVSDEMIKSYVLLAKIEAAKGSRDAVARALKEADELAADMDEFNLVSRVGLPSIKEWFADGYLGRAVRWGENDLRTLDAGPGFNLLHGAVGAARARLSMALGRPEHALNALNPLLPVLENKQATSMQIEVLVLKSLAMQSLGDLSGALKHIDHALSLSWPEKYVRTFLDEGEDMRALLRRVTGTNRKHATTLLNLFPSPADAVTPKVPTGVFELPGGVLVEPLSKRELDLIPHLAGGLSNQAIAKKLFISPDTVKVHLRHIYQKLGVSNRTQASTRASELSLK